jgi:hypothetical protein
MVSSLKLTFVANGNNTAGVGFTLGEIICLGSLEFTANHFVNQSLSPEGNDSGAIFIGMVHNGSLSLHAVLEESSNEGNTASGRGGSSKFLGPQGCNVGTPTIPIYTTPPSENTPMLVTILEVQWWTAAPQLGTGLLPEQQQAYQEEQQA